MTGIFVGEEWVGDAVVVRSFTHTHDNQESVK